jgi:HD-like signal output (HDOD) protein
MLNSALPDLAAWTAYLRDVEIPVMASTAADIADLAAAEAAGGEVAPQTLAQAANGDPLMTIKILIDAARRRSPGQVTDAENVTATVILMGTGRFFRNYAQLETVQHRLAQPPGALDGLMRVVKRSHRAARFALGFAVHRRDADAAAIHDAALLHDFVDLLLWCNAPGLSLAIRKRQLAEPSLRSADIQTELLNVTLDQLEHGLMLAWRLPELLIEITDETGNHPLRATQRRMVQLGVRLARHSAEGWANAAIPDDVHEISQLLNLSHGATQRLLREIDS